MDTTETDGATLTSVPTGPTDMHPTVSYFGRRTTYRVDLPDGVQFVEHRKLLEGDKRDYQNKVNKGVTIAQSSGDAKIELAPGDQRYVLLKLAISNFNLVGEDGQPVACSDASKETLLKLGLYDENGNDLLDKVEHDIRLKNPWLLDEVTVDKIDEQIARLQDIRTVKVAEEGKDASSAN